MNICAPAQNVYKGELGKSGGCVSTRMEQSVLDAKTAREVINVFDHFELKIKVRVEHKKNN